MDRWISLMIMKIKQWKRGIKPEKIVGDCRTRKDEEEKEDF